MFIHCLNSGKPQQNNRHVNVNNKDKKDHLWSKKLGGRIRKSGRKNSIRFDILRCHYTSQKGCICGQKTSIHITSLYIAPLAYLCLLEKLILHDSIKQGLGDIWVGFIKS